MWYTLIPAYCTYLTEIAKHKGHANMRLICVLLWSFEAPIGGQHKIYHHLHLSKFEKKTVVTFRFVLDVVQIKAFFGRPIVRGLGVLSTPPCSSGTNLCDHWWKSGLGLHSGGRGQSGLTLAVLCKRSEIENVNWSLVSVHSAFSS